MYNTNIDYIKSDLNSSPSIYNFLRPNAFRFTIKDLPKVAYTCQSANIPSLYLGTAVQHTPFRDIPKFGDKLEYGDLSIRFIIAEDMSNYLEIYEWMVALGHPDNFTQYKSFIGPRLDRFPFYKNARGDTDALGYSDGTLTILNSNNIPKTNIIFKDLFPVSIEALDYDVTVTNVEYLTGVASFKYKSFIIEAL